jgi:hypothetical protein
MKKVILYTVTILSICLTLSCTAEELPGNEINPKNTEVNANGDISITPPPKKNG